MEWTVLSGLLLGACEGLCEGMGLFPVNFNRLLHDWSAKTDLQSPPQEHTISMPACRAREYPVWERFNVEVSPTTPPLPHE